MFLKIFLIGLCLLLTLVCLHFTKYQKYRAISKKFGSCKGVPFFGVFFTLFDLKELLYKWPELIKNSESKSAFAWFGPFVPVLYTYNQNYAQKVLFSSDCNKKSNNYEILHKELGPGLLSLEGSIWKQHRKPLNPLFNQSILMNTFPMFNKKSSMLINELEHFVGKGELQLTRLIRVFTIKTSFAFFFGSELEDDNIEHVLLLDHLINFMELLADRMVTLTLNLDSIFRWTKFYQPYGQSKKYFFDFLRKLLQARIKETFSNEDMKKTDKSFLQQFVNIHLNEEFSFDELLSELNVILFAGFETTSVALENLVMMLAMHPEYQEKLFDEVQYFFPDKEFDVRYEDIQQLLYMDQFINETLRILPSVPLIGRNATQNFEISEDLVLPMGTTIIIDVFKLHRDKDIWGPNANLFNPDNFLPDNLAGKHLCSFLPFVKGQRNCIGWRYALFFLKSSLAKIVRNYRFKTSFRYEDLHPLFITSLKHKVPQLVEVYRR